MWFEIVLSSYQPMPFMCVAGNKHEAIKKTITWAAKVYPGFFITDGNEMHLAEEGYPLIAEVPEWN